MAKITRTFRLDQELVERFDKAAEQAGVDKTSVVTEAIQKFVEAVEMKTFWNTDNLVMVTEIYAPVIGRAAVAHGEANLNDDLKVIQSSLRDYNSHRKDDNGTRYNIDNVFAVIDFESKLCTIEYKEIWIGGAVESKEIKFPIRWEEKKGQLAEITEITVFEDKKEENKIEKLNYTKMNGRRYQLPKGFYAIDGRFGDQVFNERNENVTAKIMGNTKGDGYIIETDKGIAHLELLK